MQYDLQKIEYVKAVVLHGYKADVNVQVQIKLKSALDTENIQVKLVSNKKGFNQIDKRWLSNYKEMWNIPDNIYKLSWFAINKTLILSDIIKRRGKFSAEWVLVAQKTGNNARWILVNINVVLQHYSTGEVRISPRGSIYIGNVTMKRKGGDGGRDSANMLQFKLDPTQLFDI